ncbi:Clp amino terminal domain-containing protein, pathogenicity island component [Geodermatophilus dictyosporus]|uniref:Clp amino terminal domain-containing protein, pathogenicity island component n=1 Tax=Geodermatophilus dictyosporus TaxID=1523247 RepID=A0A1I5SVT6_9ACTN|nr:Clp protease N-terminal domain-containing protein [Geodermatophilus dictyosporus]SFP74873.1 Clp amino terminal domain-containing protein, pathogenicity island component [Geodermatophilus dictyosporus]
MFERFTLEARTAVVVAREEARDLRAGRIEPVHLLLALSRDPGRGGSALRAVGLDQATLRDALARSGGPLDADALAAVGIDLDRVRAAAESAFGPGALDRGSPEHPGHIPFADGGKRALEGALRHVLAQRRPRRGRVIDTGHLVVGVLAVADPVVERVLRQLGTDVVRLRQELEDRSAA